MALTPHGSIHDEANWCNYIAGSGLILPRKVPMYPSIYVFIFVNLRELTYWPKFSCMQIRLLLMFFYIQRDQMAPLNIKLVSWNHIILVFMAKCISVSLVNFVRVWTVKNVTIPINISCWLSIIWSTSIMFTWIGVNGTLVMSIVINSSPREQNGGSITDDNFFSMIISISDASGMIDEKSSLG